MQREREEGSEQLHDEQGQVSWPSGQRTANKQLQRPALGVSCLDGLRPGPICDGMYVRPHRTPYYLVGVICPYYGVETEGSSGSSTST